MIGWRGASVKTTICCRVSTEGREKDGTIQTQLEGWRLLAQ